MTSSAESQVSCRVTSGVTSTAGTPRWQRFLVEVMLFCVIALTLELICTYRLHVEGLEKANAIAQPDPFTNWRIAGGTFAREVNSDGFRGAPEITGPAPAGTTRILCIGDSVTFGGAVPPAMTYPGQLQALLSARLPAGQHVECINAGTPGCSTYHFLARLFYIAPRYQPALVTVAMGYNDTTFPRSYRATGLKTPDQTGWESQQLIGRVRGLFYHSATYRYMWRKLLHDSNDSIPGLDLGQDMHERVNGASTDNIRLMHDYLAAHHIPMVLIIVGMRGPASLAELDRTLHMMLLPDHGPEKYGELRASHRALASELGYPVLDMPAVLDSLHCPEDAVFLPRDPVHVTAEGHRIYAEALADVLWKHHLVPQAP